jgi:hypothetical protein
MSDRPTSQGPPSAAGCHARPYPDPFLIPDSAIPKPLRSSVTSSSVQESCSSCSSHRSRRGPPSVIDTSDPIDASVVTGTPETNEIPPAPVQIQQPPTNPPPQHRFSADIQSTAPGQPEGTDNLWIRTLPQSPDRALPLLYSTLPRGRIPVALWPGHPLACMHPILA